MYVKVLRVMHDTVKCRLSVFYYLILKTKHDSFKQQNSVRKKTYIGWQNDSVDKGAGRKAWGPEFNPWDTHEGERERTDS